MQIPLKFDPSLKASLQSQLSEQVRSLIIGGQLTPGNQLPSSRELSKQLGVSRNTVLNAYEDLISEGYLITKQAAGTFVCENLPDNTLMFRAENQYLLAQPKTKIHHQPLAFKGKDPGVYKPNSKRLEFDFVPGCPDPQLFPTKTWRRLANARLSYSAYSMTQYGDPAGLPELRQAIANHLGPSRGMAVSADQVIVVTGRQQGLNIVSNLFLKPGSEVVIEAPCYRGAHYVFLNAEAKLTAVPVDSEGIDVQKLPQHLVRFVYVTPSHQSFIGTTLSLQRRKELLEWASEFSAYIIEDDYDGDFRYEGSPLPALQALDDSERVIHVGSFSTSIGAGLRLGYIVVPPELIEPARIAKALLDNGSPWLEQATLADFIEQGSFVHHLKQIRQTYMVRRDSLANALRECFGDVNLSGLEGGMHLTWRLPENFPSATDLQSCLRPHRIGVYTLPDSGLDYYTQFEANDRYVLLGYAAINDTKIEQGIALLSDVIKRNL